MDSRSVTYWMFAALAAIVFVIRLPRLRRHRRQPMQWIIAGTMFLGAAAFFSAAPVAIAYINRVSGIPNLAAVIVYCLIVLLSGSLQTLIVFWRDPPERAWRQTRWWALAYVTVAATVIVLFIPGEAPVERTVDFDTYYARTPYIAEMILCYLLSYTTATLALARLCWRWSSVVGRPWLRRGLRSIVSYAIFGAGFSVTKLIAVAARWLHHDLDFLSSVVAPRLSGVGELLLAVGLFMPVYGQWITTVQGWITRRRTYRRLYPLWNAMQQATPQIALPIQLPWWEQELKLARRLTEIRDGRLALRAHFDPRVTQTANRLATQAGLSDTDQYAVIEAARLKAAIRAKALDLRYPITDGADRVGDPGAGDAVGELAWLLSVTRAFVSSPLVNEALQQSQPSTDELNQTRSN